jgi:hypothetical protein
MSDEQKAPQPKAPQPKIENLELNRETLQELTEPETDEVKGGAGLAAMTVNRSCAIHTCWC